MSLPPSSNLPTHSVENQPEPAGDRDLWADDPVLQSCCPPDAELARYGAALGLADTRKKGRDANRHTPELALFDAHGRRLDEVSFHPAYHDMMSLSQAAGYAAVPWEAQPHGHTRHAAMVYMASQVEPGHCCPLTMTYAAVPALQASPELSQTWRSKLISRNYDPSIRPIEKKHSATLGMAMTEKQGGSDVRTNTTRAEKDGAYWRLTGHKWFCSAPMSDGFLTLAQSPGGLTCFLVPRWLDDRRNAIHLMRLKDKLGNRSNASAEIEYDRALAYQVGEDGRGIPTIIEMVHHTRLDTAMAPAGLMRGAVMEAIGWAQHRSAFQKRLIDQPLMRTVLADLCLDCEAATRLGFRVAQAFDETGAESRAFARIAVALAKFLNNKLCARVTYEALEVMGGLGFIEDSPMPLYYREAPLNGIWEGSGNVICLDILRTLAREPDSATAMVAELESVRGANKYFDTAFAQHVSRWPGLPGESEARLYCERLALLLAGAVLIRTARDAISESFVTSRISALEGRITGAVSGLQTDAILEQFENTQS